MNTSETEQPKARFNTLLAQGIHFFYRLLIKPKSADEDTKRRELILNIILTFSFVALFLLDQSIFISELTNPAFHGIPFLLFTGVVLVSGFLLFLSRKGFIKTASYLLLLFYFVLTMYGVYHWSLVLPMIILGSVMIIVISSILIGIRFSFVATLLIIIGVITITHFQITGFIHAHLYWKSEPLQIKDAVEISIIFLLITAISWLSNREMERSLKRARQSEQALTEERNLLEIKVEERTKELKQAQMEKVAQLYRFAEFGKLSSGIFHDLMNPLNAVIANVSRLESAPENISKDLPEVENYLKKAVFASRRMGDFLGTIRKQIRPSESEELFSLNKEVHEAIDILQYKARTAGVLLKIKDPRELTFFGNPLKFHQIALNLISNAIDSYEDVNQNEKIVHITLRTYDDTILLRVTDYGCGIPEEIKPYLFEQFFTTKSPNKGMGIGLSSTKSIIENDFNGNIRVERTPGNGSSFSDFLKQNQK